MNIDTYLQMKALEEQQGAQGQPVPQSSGMTENPSVPRGTHLSTKPLSYGSRAAIEAVRESIGNRTNDFTRSLGRLSANIGRGLYAKSGTKFGETMSQIPYDPYADEDARIKENMEILDYIKKAEQAQQMQEHHMRQLEQHDAARQQQYLMHQESLAEQARHHRSAEEMQHALHAYQIEDAQEGREIADKIKQETGDYVQPMSAMKPQMQNYANREIRTYAEKATSAAEGLEATKRMREIALKNPKILGNWDYIIAYKNAKDPGYANQLLMNLKISKKNKDDLLEMASLAKTFNVKSLQGIPAKGMNQMIERELFSANPNARMSQGALLRVLEKAEDGLTHGYEEYSKASQYGDSGFLYKPKARKLNHSPKTAAQQVYSQPAAMPPLHELSDEELNAMLGAQ